MTAIRFDASADRLQRTSDLPDYNSTYTFMAWVYLVSDRDAFGDILCLNGASDQYDLVGVNSSGTQLIAEVGFTSTVTGGTLTTGTWYHLALVRESTTSLKVYLNGVLNITNTANVSGRTAVTRMEINGTDTEGEWCDMRVAHIKAWTAALTVDEVLSEMQTIQPQRHTNLYGWWPTWTGSGERNKDYSGNGRDWTEAGTLTEADPPPVSYGAPTTFVNSTLFQYAYPVSDVTDGAWTTDTGGTSLFAAIDETSPNDADYIQSELAPSASACTIRLGSVTDPGVHTGHALSYRYDKTPSDGAQINLTVRVKQSTTTIASQTHTNVSNGFLEGTIVLTEGEAANITDYTAVDVQFETTQV